MRKATARSVALDALLEMERREGYSNLVMDRALRDSALDPRDSALASAIFYGVLEKRIALDWALARCLKDPGRRMDRTVRTCLRCGAYQILCLDRVPDSAAVNETVSLCRERGKAALSGFVNGVLRRLSREKESLTLPEGDDAAAWSVRYAVPEPLIELWRRAYGKDVTLRLLQSFSRPAETYVRVNTARTTAAKLAAALAQRGIELEPLPFPEGCAVLRNSGSPALLPEFTQGLFHVQDLSAQLACALLAPKPGETVYDCCAAPGGKSFTMAEGMVGAGGRVTAFDLHEGRVELIREGARRLGLGNVSAKARDMTAPITGLPLADKVLCDVPCSGTGVIRRKPEIRYKDPNGVGELPRLQRSILTNAAALVRPGGLLLYSTCALDPAENGAVAQAFLRETPGFVPVTIELPGVDRVIDEPENQWTLFPFAGASDGFFTALFRRTEEG